MSKGSRSGKHVDMNDRKLRPLYDSLDNNENKRTLQEADKLLKKTPNLHCAKALKALALMRLGRREEAEVVLALLEDVDDHDDNTIHALNAVFKEMHDYEAIVRLYERVGTKQHGEEQLTHLFMAYIRVQDYTNLQKIAIKLHKLNPNNKHYIYWNISGYFLQSLKDPEMGERLYLKMAETLAEKCIKNNNMNTLSEVVLYTKILERRKKFVEIHDLLRSPLADIIKKEDGLYYDQLSRKYLIKLQKWSQANVELKDFLCNNPDDFLVFQEYIQIAHHLWSPSNTSNEVLQVISQVGEVIQNAINSPVLMDIIDEVKQNGDNDDGVKPKHDDNDVEVKPKHDDNDEVKPKHDDNDGEVKPKHDDDVKPKHDDNDEVKPKHDDNDDEVKPKHDDNDEVKPKHDDNDDDVKPKHDDNDDVKPKHDDNDEVKPKHDDNDDEVKPKHDDNDDEVKPKHDDNDGEVKPKHDDNDEVKPKHDDNDDDEKQNGDDEKQNGDDEKQNGDEIKRELDVSWSSVASYINACITQNEQKPPLLRGPYLAQMELVLYLKNISIRDPYHYLEGGGDDACGSGGGGYGAGGSGGYGGYDAGGSSGWCGGGISGWGGGGYGAGGGSGGGAGRGSNNSDNDTGGSNGNDSAGGNGSNNSGNDSVCGNDDSGNDSVGGNGNYDLYLYTQEVWQKVMAPILVKLVLRYSTTFGDKPCCFSDIRRYLNHLNAHSKSQLLSMMAETLGFCVDSYADNIVLINDEKSMWKHLLFTIVTYYCHPDDGDDDNDDNKNIPGDNDDNKNIPGDNGDNKNIPGDNGDKIKGVDESEYRRVEDLMEASSDLMRYFGHALQFGQHLSTTEIQPAEGYVLVRAQLLLSIHQKTGHLLPLLRVIVELEEALVSSPSCHLLKINLIRLCSMLGDTGKCYTLFTSMDVKYIQLDSIGYLLSNTLQLNGDMTKALTFHHSCLAFFETAPHDLINYAVMTFKWNNYHKTDELINFGHLLENSLQFMTSTISSTLLSILSTIHQFDLLTIEINTCQYIITNLPTNKISNIRGVDVAFSFLYTGDMEAYKEEVKTEEIYWLLIESRILAYLYSIINSIIQPIDQQNDQSTSQQNGQSTSQQNDQSTSQQNDQSTNQSNNQAINESTSVQKEKEDATNNQKITNDDSKHFDINSSSLFNARDPFEDLDQIAGSASSFLANKEYKCMFPTPLYSFTHHNLHSSLLQFSSLHRSILSVTLQPALDSSIQETHMKSLQIYKLSEMVPTTPIWFLQKVETTRLCYLLLQHLGSLLCVLQCCIQLMAPFKVKKGKKKNPNPRIPATTHNFDVHAYVVKKAHAALLLYFTLDPTPQQQTKDTYVKDNETDAVVERMLANHVKLQSEAHDLLSKWAPVLQTITNRNFKPEVAEISDALGQKLNI